MNKPDKIKKDTYIKIRLSVDEKNKIEELAKACSKKTSEYARDRLLGYRVDNTKKEIIAFNAQAVANLNMIAREVVRFPNKVDTLVLLDALNSIEEKLYARV